MALATSITNMGGRGGGHPTLVDAYAQCGDTNAARERSGQMSEPGSVEYRSTGISDTESEQDTSKADMNTNGDDAKERALKSIEQFGKRLHSTTLIALAYRADADPFGKTRNIIEEMIARLFQDIADKTTPEGFLRQ